MKPRTIHCKRFRNWLVVAATVLSAGQDVTARTVVAPDVEAVPTISGDPYFWPAYNPTISYNFRDEYPNVTMPTRDLEDCSGVVGTQSDRWWTFKWGARKNSLVTGTAITPMLAYFNREFAYFRDTMGWPPDRRVLNGYRSAIYLYGSGLCTDNESNTALGGWQSSVGGNPIVLASYYPVYSFDPACTYPDRNSQMGAMIHEGIHSILASLPGARQAAWFHEGGNTWLQQQANAQRTNDYANMGFLNGCAFIAPFMPIECYSGWLQDGSFGGPAAEGVNRSSGSQQICTWRRYLGGTQYGNGFPTFLGVWLGLGSGPWVWKNCPVRVLEGMAAGLGDEQMRRLIVEYRAKQATLDMGKWSNAFKKLLNDNFGVTVGAEWEPYWINCESWKMTPYAKTSNDGTGVLTPEQRTTPGWSGANQIPLKVTGTMAAVDFQPIGENMTCQLCYRTTDGYPVYGVPVSGGTCNLRLDKAPAGGTIIAVICNTDYRYIGEETRKTHYDYRLKLGAGMTVADINTRWYNVNLVDGVSLRALKRTAQDDCRPFVSFESRNTVAVRYHTTPPGRVSVALYTPRGELVRRATTGSRTDKLTFSIDGLANGAYIVQVRTGTGSLSAPLMVHR